MNNNIPNICELNKSIKSLKGILDEWQSCVFNPNPGELYISVRQFYVPAHNKQNGFIIVNIDDILLCVSSEKISSLNAGIFLHNNTEVDIYVFNSKELRLLS